MIGKAVVKAGGDSFFFLSTDNAFGHSLEKDTGDVVKANGGKVAGAVRHPLNNPDFSSFLLQAQAPKAKVVGLANAGGDTVNSIKAAAEFGLTKSQNLAALLMLITDVHALGLNTAKACISPKVGTGTPTTRRACLPSVSNHATTAKPNMNQVGVYSAVAHYLKMCKRPARMTRPPCARKWARCRSTTCLPRTASSREDGRMVHDMYLFQVKKPSESKGPWDYYTLKGTVKGEDAFQSMAASRCPQFMKKG